MRTHRDLIKDFVNEPASALDYLKASLELSEQDGDWDSFLLAIRNVAEARGGITKLAEETDLNTQHLSRSLAENGNPPLKTLDSVLHALGLKLSIEMTPAGP